MKLSDLKGKRQLAALSKIMALADKLADDEDAKRLLEAARGEGGQVRAILAYGSPIIDRYSDEIIDVLAYVSGVDPADYAENGNILADAVSLLTEDQEALDFLSLRQTGSGGASSGTA